MKDITEILEQSWASGALWKLRYRQFDREGLLELRDALREARLPSDLLSRDLVRLLWYIPIFLEWNTGAALEASGHRGDGRELVNSISAEVERLLGVP